MTTYTDVPIAHAIPVRPDNLTSIAISPVIEIPNETRNIIINAYQYRKTIKTLSLIDLFFVFISILTTQYPAYLLNFLMIYCGYYGADKYHSLFINVYILYNILYVLGLISTGIYLYRDNNQEINQFSYFFIGLSCLIAVWITKICYSFKNVIQLLKDDDLLNALRNGDYLFTHQSSWNRNYLS